MSASKNFGVNLERASTRRTIVARRRTPQKQRQNSIWSGVGRGRAQQSSDGPHETLRARPVCRRSGPAATMPLLHQPLRPGRRPAGGRQIARQLGLLTAATVVSTSTIHAKAGADGRIRCHRAGTGTPHCKGDQKRAIRAASSSAPVRSRTAPRRPAARSISPRPGPSRARLHVHHHVGVRARPVRAASGRSYGAPSSRPSAAPGGLWSSRCPIARTGRRRPASSAKVPGRGGRRRPSANAVGRRIIPDTLRRPGAGLAERRRLD